MKKFAIAALIILMIGATAPSVFASNTGGPTGNGGAGAPTPPAESVPATLPPSNPPAGSGTVTPPPTGTSTTITPPSIYTGTNLGDKTPQRYNFRQIANELLPSVATWMASALGALAVLFLIWAGIQFLTAEGDPEKIGAATKTALYVIVGVVLVMFAYAMVYLFLSLFVPA